MRTVVSLALACSFSASVQDATAVSRADFGSATLGGEGLADVRSAMLVENSLTFSSHFDFFSQENLAALGERDEYRALVISAAVTPLQWLELSAAARSTTLDQLSGGASTRTPLENDLFFRLKLAARPVSWLALGADATARIPPPASAGQTGFPNTSGQFSGLASIDFSGTGLPLRLHVNAGYLLDNSKALGIADQARSIALGLDPYNQFVEGAGLEARFEAGNVWVVPFVEQTLDVPLSSAHDTSAFPLQLTPGLRVLPWRGLYLDAAVSLGLTPHQILGVPPVPAVMGVFSLGYQLDWTREDRVVERIVEKPVEKAPTKGTVRGVVRDAATQHPLPDVVVALPGKNRVLADAVGTFTATDMDPGTITVKAWARGFTPGEAQGEVKAGEVVSLDLELTALPPPPPAPVTLKGTVLSEDGQPVDATFTVPGTSVTAAAPQGDYVLTVPAGEVDVNVSAKGYQEQGRRVTADPGETVVLDFVLKPVARTRFVILHKDKIEIRKQVHFAVARDIILPDSDQLLDEIAATILSNLDAVPRLRVEGHTDGQGDDAHNMDLSTRRAEAVVHALEERGVPRSRLTAFGFGRSRPIAPNDTEKGRAKNRRVEFVIESSS